MAFVRTNLSGNVGAGSSAPKFMTYNAGADAKADVVGADYFLSANDVLEANDAILVVASNGMIIVRVTASSSATVTTELLEVDTL